jgi:simple sugar transport system permease protein
MRRWLVTLTVIVVSGFAVVVAVGASPYEAVAGALDASVGSAWAIQETLVKTVPLLWCGLAVAVAFTAGVWNIGAEGQLLAGAAAATTVALAVPAGPWHLPLTLAGGAVGGAALASVAAWLRRAAGVNEVLSTILLNLVAVYLVGWAVHGPLREPGGVYPQSAAIAPTAQLARFFPPGRLHAGLVLVVLVTLVLAIGLRYTRWGLTVRCVGDRAAAARACGVPVATIQARVLVLSGALAGLGGATEVAGVTHRLFENLSPGWGYSGIAVALLGGLAPLGTALAALFFGGMAAASGGMQRGAGVPAVGVLLMQGLVIVALAWLGREERARQ